MKNSVRLGLLGILVLGVGFGTLWWLQTTSTPPIVELPQIAGSSLSNITLTEVDKNGKLLWEIAADQAEYSENNRRAVLTRIRGKFFKAGEELIAVTGAKGSIDLTTKKITIEGKVEAIAKKDNINVKSDRMIWQPDQELLTATGNLQIARTAKNPDDRIKMVGRTLTAYPSQNLFTITQDVVATAIKPPIQIKSDKLMWNAAKNLVTSPKAIAILQTKDRLSLNSDRGEWNINSQQVSLDGNIRAKVPESGINIETSSLVWDINQQLVNIDSALKVVSLTRMVALTANTGQANLATKTMRLNGQVQANSVLRQAKLNADQVEWIIPAQTLTLEGNINYAQAEKDLKVSGTKAIVDIKAQTIKLTGKDVITRITP